MFSFVACGGDADGGNAWDPPEASSSSGVVAPPDESSSAGATPEPEPQDSSSSDDGDPPPVPMPDVPQNTCPRARVSVALGEVLNVRAEPTSASDELGELPNNAIVDVLDAASGETIEGVDTWLQIAQGELVGWVSGAYAECTFEDPPELEPPAGFHLPLECGTTTSIAQGNDGGFSHQGAAFFAYDFSVAIGTPLVGMADGIVAYTYAETMPGDPCYDGGGPECFAYGNLVVLRHGDGSTSLYKHLNEVWVGDGEFVPAGFPVGLSGSTGYSTGPHAHVMRMEDCGMAQCQSIPLEFVEAGVPDTGDSVTSENCPS